MSAGWVGTIGSVVTGQLQQTRSADAERAAREAANQARQNDASLRAENAAGVGEMREEGAASERDADGRRPWEQGSRRRETLREAAELPAGSAAEPCSRDPSGEAGTQLDLSG